MLSESILSRFDVYAKRVRLLSGDYFLPKFHLDPYARTYLSSFRCPLIPGLREISICQLYKHEWTILLALCSRKVKIVDLVDEGANKYARTHTIGAFLRSLECEESHGLEKLCILTAHFSHVDLITKFHTLQDVELWFTEGTTGVQLVAGFSKLSALNHLSRLRIDLIVDNDYMSFASPSLPPHSVIFRSLHSIDINVPTTTALFLVQCLRADTLKCIQVHCHQYPPRHPNIFRQIAKECGSVGPSLEEVDLNFSGDPPIHRETFDRVLDLSRRFRLRTIKFAWSGLEIDDTYIRNACLSGCFSHLEVLNFVTYDAIYSPTFQVLRSLAIHCPVLEDLYLTFTVEEGHLPLLVKEMENERPLSHRLRSLKISLEDKPKTTKFLANGESIPIVSQYLDSLFPSLDLIEANGIIQYDAFKRAICRTIKGLRHRPTVDSRRLIGFQVTNP